MGHRLPLWFRADANLTPWAVAVTRSWWNQPDHFGWVTDFLRLAGLLALARVMLLAIAGSSVLLPVALLADAGGLQVGGAVAVAVCTVYWVWATAFWMRTPWPTQGQSQALVALGSVDVAWWTLIQPNATLAALGCTALAVTGGYIALFHSVKMTATNICLGLVVAGIAAVRIAENNVVIAVASFWLVCLLVIAVPACIQAIAHAMRVHATHSRHDPLTNLLNRRGFADALTTLTPGKPAARYVSVLFLDLDDFKRLNDTRGHATGDQALRDVADLLRTHLPEAIIARAGGEEFLVAQSVTTPAPHATSDRVRRAIAALDYGLTASIGSATSDALAITTPAHVDALVSLADDAMYVAKRNGGNRTHHATPPRPDTAFRR